VLVGPPDESQMLKNKLLAVEKMEISAVLENGRLVKTQYLLQHAIFAGIVCLDYTVRTSRGEN
jgi:hypothetical protein